MAIDLLLSPQASARQALSVKPALDSAGGREDSFSLPDTQASTQTSETRKSQVQSADGQPSRPAETEEANDTADAHQSAHSVATDDSGTPTGALADGRSGLQADIDPQSATQGALTPERLLPPFGRTMPQGAIADTAASLSFAQMSGAPSGTAVTSAAGAVTTTNGMAMLSGKLPTAAGSVTAAHSGSQASALAASGVMSAQPSATSQSATGQSIGSGLFPGSGLSISSGLPFGSEQFSSSGLSTSPATSSLPSGDGLPGMSQLGGTLMRSAADTAPANALSQAMASASSVDGTATDATARPPISQWGPLPLTAAAAAPQHARELLPPLRDQLRFQLDQRIQHAELRLDPPDMGKIDLNIRLDGDRLHIQMHAANNQIRDALQSGLDRLRAELAQDHQGDIQLDIGQGEQQGQQHASGRQDSRLASATVADATTEAPHSGLSPHADGGLNLLA
ncbi:flagellar hook-length control protein FliK [Shewanella sp. GXUN23E]|uniref:flagellar hook-length control protein FliK n=1 Tax=Shewanella sp. GXUN23E TaxID=3422498 RepID=UPI003D7E2469